MYRLTSAKVKNYATATSIVDALQKAWGHFEEHMPAYGTDIYKGSDSVTVDFDTNSDHIPVDVVQDLCRLAGVDPRENDDDGLHWPSAPSLDQAVKGLKKFCKNESVSVNEAITQSQLQQAVDILSKKWNIPSKKLLSDPTDQQLDQIEALAKKMKSTGSHSIGDYLNEAFLGVHLEPSDAAKIAKIVKPDKMNLTGFSEWLYAQLEDEFESVDEVLDRLKATSNDEMEEYDLNRAEYQREIKKVLSQALYEFESMKGESTKSFAVSMKTKDVLSKYAIGSKAVKYLLDYVGPKVIFRFNPEFNNFRRDAELSGKFGIQRFQIGTTIHGQPAFMVKDDDDSVHYVVGQ